MPGVAPGPAYASAPLESGRSHVAGLEGLRALGAVAVFVKHSSLATGKQYDSGWAWLNHFEIGPTLFFVLSAFLVYQPFAAAHLAGRPLPSLRRFARHRALRVIPAYWVALVIMLVFLRAPEQGSFGLHVRDARSVLQLFTFTQIYDPVRFFDGIAAAYTLCVEVSFYVFVAGWVVLVRRIAPRAAAPAQRLRVEFAGIGVLVGLALLWRFLVGFVFRPDGDAVCSATSTHWTCAAANWLPGYLGYFALGMSFAVLVVWTRHHGPIAAFDRATDRTAVWLVAAGGLFWLYSARYGTRGLDSLAGIDGEVRHLLNGLIVLAAIMPLLGRRRSRYRALLAWRPLLYLGVVSYGFYLWHQAFIDRLMIWTDARPFDGSFAVVAPAAFALAIAAAAVSHRAIEEPIRRRRDVLFGGGRT